MKNITKQKNKSGDLVLIKCPDQSSIRYIRESLYTLISILQNNSPKSTDVKKQLDQIEINFIATAGTDDEPLILTLNDIKNLFTLTQGIIIQDQKENIVLNKMEQNGQKAIAFIHSFLEWVIK